MLRRLVSLNLDQQSNRCAQLGHVLSFQAPHLRFEPLYRDASDLQSISSRSFGEAVQVARLDFKSPMVLLVLGFPLGERYHQSDRET